MNLFELLNFKNTKIFFKLKFKDAFGTSIESYLISFSKYDLSNIFPERYPKINSY